MAALGVIVAIVVIVAIIYIVLYNGLIALRNRVEEGWAQIDVQLKRRADLIPNLVETVKGYATHERGVFEAVTTARASLSKTLDNGTPKQIGEANNALTSALGSLFAVAENYPTLQASQNFLSLQEELATTENKVAFARQYYNDVVRQLNTKIQGFPGNIVAHLHHIKESEYFELENPQDKVAPKVQF
jgi:LemA protein